ncbi:hypothetical protein AAHC03_01548 [Spirometra sp. Aus1]
MDRFQQQLKSNSANQQTCSTAPVLNLVNLLLTPNFPNGEARQFLDPKNCVEPMKVNESRLHQLSPSTSGLAEVTYGGEGKRKFVCWPANDMGCYETAEAGVLRPVPEYGPISPPDTRCAIARGNAVEVRHEMKLSNDLIGCVIGRGGAKINDIRRISKAHIKISNAEEWTNIRRITVIGNPKAVNTAVQMIESSVHLHKQLLAMNIAMDIVYNHRPTTS